MNQDYEDDTPDDFDAAVESELAATVVTAPRQEPARDEPKPAIMFEGRAVDRTEINIKGLTGLSEAYDGLKIGLDDRVRLVVEARAAKVDHYISKDGELVRSQELRVNVADIIPWDPTNPDDDGVLRA